MPKQASISTNSKKSDNFLNQQHFITPCTTVTDENDEEFDELASSAFESPVNARAEKRPNLSATASPRFPLANTLMQTDIDEPRIGSAHVKAAERASKAIKRIRGANRSATGNPRLPLTANAASVTRRKGKTSPAQKLQRRLHNDASGAKGEDASVKARQHETITRAQEHEVVEENPLTTLGRPRRDTTDATAASLETAAAVDCLIVRPLRNKEKAPSDSNVTRNVSTSADKGSAEELKFPSATNSPASFYKELKRRKIIEGTEFSDMLVERILQEQIHTNAVPTESSQVQAQSKEEGSAPRLMQELEQMRSCSISTEGQFDQQDKVDRNEVLEYLRNKAVELSESMSGLTNDLSKLHEEHQQLKQEHTKLQLYSADLEINSQTLQKTSDEQKSVFEQYKAQTQERLTDLGDELKLLSIRYDGAKEQQRDTAANLAEEKDRSKALMKQLSNANERYDRLQSSMEQESKDIKANFTDLAASINKAMVPASLCGDSEQIRDAIQDLAKHGRNVSEGMNRLESTFSLSATHLASKLGDIIAKQQDQMAAIRVGSHVNEQLLSDISEKVNLGVHPDMSSLTQLQEANAALKEQLRATEMLVSERAQQREDPQLQESILKRRVTELEENLQAVNNQLAFDKHLVLQAHESMSRQMDLCNQLSEKKRALSNARKAQGEQNQITEKMMIELALSTKRLEHSEEISNQLRERINGLEQCAGPSIDEARKQWESEARIARERMEQSHNEALQAVVGEKEQISQQLQDFRVMYENLQRDANSFLRERHATESTSFTDVSQSQFDCDSELIPIPCLSASARPGFLDSTLSPDLDLKCSDESMQQSLTIPETETTSDANMILDISPDLLVLNPEAFHLFKNDEDEKNVQIPTEEALEDHDCDRLIAQQLQQADAYVQERPANARQTARASCMRKSGAGRASRASKSRVAFAEQATEPGELGRSSTDAAETRSRFFSQPTTTDQGDQAEGAQASTQAGSDLGQDHSGEASTHNGTRGSEDDTTQNVSPHHQDGVAPRRISLRPTNSSLKRAVEDRSSGAPPSTKRQRQATAGHDPSPSIPITTSSRRVRAFAAPPPPSPSRQRGQGRSAGGQRGGSRGGGRAGRGSGSGGGHDGSSSSSHHDHPPAAETPRRAASRKQSRG